MIDHALPAYLDGEQGDDVAFEPYIADDRELSNASDGDGAMLGRVLIYAGIIAIGVVAIVWKQFA